MMSDYARYPSLNGKGVLITGGGSGIGAALTRAFAEQGAKTVFCDIQYAPSVALADEIAAETGNPPYFISCDLTDVDGIATMVAQAEELVGPLQALVNNAGNDDRHTPEDVTPEYWENRIAINLRHYFFAAQAAGKLMKKSGGGSIINFSSISWHRAIADLPLYVTCNAAITGMTRGLARDWGPDNIRVNAIVPGSIETQRQKDLWLTDESRADIFSKQCLKVGIEPHFVAKMALFLAADDSAMCTGREFFVDAGWL